MSIQTMTVDALQTRWCQIQQWLEDMTPTEYDGERGERLIIEQDQIDNELNHRGITW